MSYEEKRAWFYAVVAVVVPVIYAVAVLGQLSGADVTQIPYARPLLLAAGTGIAANMLVTMLIGAPKDARRGDERDAGIFRHATRVGYVVLAAGAGGAFLLTLAGVAHFWIANALYLAFVLDALVTSTVKIVAYRRGF
jgi:peptidoglycan biosynthesis protein MviN/MurJ (putative lipid II flippase)